MTNIEVGVLYFKVSPDNYTAPLIERYVRQHLIMVDKKRGQNAGPIMVEKERYFVKSFAGWRFHINMLDHFLHYLRNNYITFGQLSFTERSAYIPTKVDVQLTTEKTPREDQIPVIEFLKKPLPIRLVGIQTGKGKTYTSSVGVHYWGERALYSLKPKFIEKWIEDLKENLLATDDDIAVIAGAFAVKALIEVAKAGTLKAKYIIFSSKTFQGYVSAYESGLDNFKLQGYEVAPDDLWELLGIGTYLVDEVHEEFNLNFKLMLYVNAPRFIALSATLINNQPFMERMYELAFPKDMRYEQVVYDKYIEVYALNYQFKNPKNIRTTNFGSTDYSHIAFEKSVFKHIPTRNAYLTMIADLTESFYLSPEYQPGDKLGIYCSMIETCSIVVKFLKDIFPDKDIRKFTGGDPYKNLLEPDIRVSTPGKFGSAMDVKGLTVVINTVPMDSATSNVQIPGRLRYIEGRSVKYVYIFSKQFPKHEKYHNVRMRLLGSRVKFIRHGVYEKFI